MVIRVRDAMFDRLVVEIVIERRDSPAGMLRALTQPEARNYFPWLIADCKRVLVQPTAILSFAMNRTIYCFMSIK